MLKSGLSSGITSYDGILGQCMYFGLSFSRVGVDFRGLMVPIFKQVISRRFISKMGACDQRFKQEMERFTLINKTVIMYGRIAKPPPKEFKEEENDEMVPEFYAPPESLLYFYPLACLCNDYLNIFNDLRLCAPTGMATIVTRRVQMSLVNAGNHILTFYKQEQQAFTANERNLFNKLCSSFAYDLVPYLQNCINAIYPAKLLCLQLGVNHNGLKDVGIMSLDQKEILASLKHLLPSKTEISEDIKIEVDTQMTNIENEA